MNLDFWGNLEIDLNIDWLPNEELDRKPGITDALHEEERVVRVCPVFVQRPGSHIKGRPHCEIVDHWDSHVRVGLQTESQYGDTNEENRDNSHSLRHKDFQSNVFIEYTFTSVRK